MNVTKKQPPRKEEFRLRPDREEGLYIQYRLKTIGINFSKVAQIVGVSQQFIPLVVFGQRCSRRVESTITQLLNKSSWNDIVLEARSEVQKKPVSTIVKEMERGLQAESRSIKKRIQNNAQTAIFNKDWSAHLKELAKEQAMESEKLKRINRRRA